MNHWRMYGVNPNHKQEFIQLLKDNFNLIKVSDWGNYIMVYSTEEIPDGFGVKHVGL